MIGNFTNCTVTIPQWIGDGQCDGGDYNTIECGFDGGDCNNFNMNFPACDAEFPFLLSNGKCESGAYIPLNAIMTEEIAICTTCTLSAMSLIPNG